MERVSTLNDVATRMDEIETSMDENIKTRLGPYLSAKLPKTGAANPLTSQPILAARLIDETFVPHSVLHKSMKIPNPCRVPITSDVDRNSAATISHP